MQDCRFYLDDTVIPKGVISTSFGNNYTAEQPLFVNCGACINTEQEHINKNDHGRHDYYFIYLVSGHLQDILTDSGVSVEPGNVIVIPPDTPWRFFCTGKHIYFYCVHFTGSQAKNVLDEFGIKIFPEMNRISVDNELQKRFHRLFDAFVKKDEFRHKDLANYLNGIFIETARAIEYDRFDKIILSKSIRYINAFYTTGIKISDLAKMENMCVTLYNKHFKSIMKTTPTKYIMTLRIHYACELILNSDMQINEIAANCGYKDANFFIRVFKKCVGQTPLAYKKSILSN